MIKIWEGEKLSKTQAMEVSGVDEVQWLTAFDDSLKINAAQVEDFYFLINEHQRARKEILTRDERMSQILIPQFPGKTLQNSYPILEKLRQKKRPEEIHAMEKACAITREGFKRCLKALKPGTYEYMLEAEFAYSFTQMGANGFAYEPIVASVGLSGGVDSSVAAYLMKKAGHEVIGVFMRNWNDADPTLEEECPWIEDSTDAMLVAEKLDIPFQVIDLSKDYEQRIVHYMFSEYEQGRTPNPDVLCNREIKFDLFLKIALDLGADGVATGHYVQKKTDKNSEGEVVHHLLAGADPNKDQSYFLCQLNQAQLAYAHFPIGHMQKSEVRALANEIGLDNAQKKDSQGLCFIGK
ncbi:unnamed protein product, partial [Cyprideis torosa]